MADRPLTPLLATDCVIRVGEGIVLIRRGNPPFQGHFALPGGFVDVGESVEDACRREMREETGLELEDIELLGVYSDPERDPRGHCVSVVFTAVSDGDGLQAGDDAADAAVVSDPLSQDLAFDHAIVIGDALERFRKAP